MRRCEVSRSGDTFCSSLLCRFGAVAAARRCHAVRVILNFAPSGSIYCDCRAADECGLKKGSCPARLAPPRHLFVVFFACLLLYTALRCNNHRFSKSLMGMTTLGEVYRMSRMSRRCPEGFWSKCSYLTFRHLRRPAPHPWLN